MNDEGTWSLGLLQMDFFYRKRKWYAGQFVRKITPKITIKQGAIPFFSTILNQQKPLLLSVLVRNIDKTFRQLKVYLPITNDNIDFDFMESFISELEAERISELFDYLKTSRLDNCDLSAIELQALYNFNNIQWGKYKIGTLFTKIETKKLTYKAKDLPTKATGKNTLPCLTSSFNNQGLNYYAPQDGATILKNVITIPQNSDVYRAYYQSSDFTVLSDAYAIKWNYNKKLISRNQYLFMVMCINKVTDLPIYTYKNKLGGWNIVKGKSILLPQKDGEIDLEYMENFITAIQKLTIKSVVEYTNSKIAATKKIIHNNIE